MTTQRMWVVWLMPDGATPSDRFWSSWHRVGDGDNRALCGRPYGDLASFTATKGPGRACPECRGRACPECREPVGVDGIDWWTCPNCGNDDLRIRALERALQHITVEINVDDDGDVDGAEWGESRLVGESQTVEYFCADCLAALPEAYQDELDRLLENTRDRTDPLYGDAS